MKLPVSPIIAYLQRHQSRKIPWRRNLTRSAVAVVLYENDGDTEVLLMQRAQREGDPWSGHISFPGGKMQSDDRSALNAAKRELHEEMGIEIDDFADVSGRLSDVVTRRHEKPVPMIVTPYVFNCKTRPVIDHNYEAVTAFWMPLSFLLDENNRDTLVWKLGSKNVKIPITMACYNFENKRLWGLTLRMLEELLVIAKGKGNSRRKEANHA